MNSFVPSSNEPCVDVHNATVFKDNQVTNEISPKTMAMVDDLAKKFDMLINDTVLRDSQYI